MAKMYIDSFVCFCSCSLKEPMNVGKMLVFRSLLKATSTGRGRRNNLRKDRAANNVVSPYCDSRDALVNGLPWSVVQKRMFQSVQQCKLHFAS